MRKFLEVPKTFHSSHEMVIKFTCGYFLPGSLLAVALTCQTWKLAEISVLFIFKLCTATSELGGILRGCCKWFLNENGAWNSLDLTLYPGISFEHITSIYDIGQFGQFSGLNNQRTRPNVGRYILYTHCLCFLNHVGTLPCDFLVKYGVVFPVLILGGKPAPLKAPLSNRDCSRKQKNHSENHRGFLQIILRFSHQFQFLYIDNSRHFRSFQQFQPGGRRGNWASVSAWADTPPLA